MPKDRSNHPPKNQHHFTNRLVHEKSPYLLQHAHNPVDWYSWGKDAFESARMKDRPIFLSIGYSTCHWCHVMARESFENEDIAKILNENFISIKVDREDLPEVDHLYMRALTEVMGGHGGWPISVWLTPDLKPFMGGTYLPPVKRFGLPSFPSVLQGIAQKWQEDRTELIENAEIVQQKIQEIDSVPLSGDLNKNLIKNAFNLFEQNFDPIYGGLRGAPKFPQPALLSFLLRYHYRTRSPRALEMVEIQLQNMAQGGIYDHLGGGFARYTTDKKWHVPHFEKMMYDNVLLLRVYAEAYQLTGKNLYKCVIKETAHYLLNTMQDSLGGFYAAEDAESEGVEGKFYVWRRSEIKEVLGKDAHLFCLLYDISDEGNWLDPHLQTRGLNILNKKMPLNELAKQEEIELPKLKTIIKSAKKKLVQARNQRVRPGKDNKVLVSWNGLAISALSYAGRAIGQEEYIHAARNAAEFVHNNLYDNKKLIHRWCEGEAKGTTTLEDYAYLCTGLLDLYEASFEDKWLKLAYEINKTAVELFYDEKAGGFYLTEKDRSDLFVRNKYATDGAIPNANSVAVLNCLRLFHIFGEDKLRLHAEQTLFAYGAMLDKLSFECPSLRIALDAFLSSNREIVLAGETKAIKTILDELFLP